MYKYQYKHSNPIPHLTPKVNRSTQENAYTLTSVGVRK